jgi:hypothetical protein
MAKSGGAIVKVWEAHSDDGHVYIDGIGPGVRAASPS